MAALELDEPFVFFMVFENVVLRVASPADLGTFLAAETLTLVLALEELVTRLLARNPVTDLIAFLRAL
jgi:hypothetical protein